MNKTLRALLSFLLALILCAGLSLTAFASEGNSEEEFSLGSLLNILSELGGSESDDNTESDDKSDNDFSLENLLSLFTETDETGSDEASEGDASLEDLIGLFGALLGSESEETPDSEIELNEYTLHDVTFSLPADWISEEEDDDNLMFYASDFMKFGTASYYDGEDEEELDIHDEDIIELFTEDGMETIIEYVTVCGYDTLWIESSSSEEDFKSTNYGIIISFGGPMFFLGYSVVGDEPSDEFYRIVEGITIDGADGETDISAVYDGSFLPSVPLGTKETGTEEIVLMDTEDCFVSIKDFSTDNEYYALTAKVYIENNTDKSLYYSFDNISVNDYMCNTYFGTTVDAGNKKNEDLYFYKDSFEDNNIEYVHDIEFILSVTDSDDWFAEPIAEIPVKLYPFGEDVPEQEPQEFDDDTLVLIDNEDYVMYLTGFSSDPFSFNVNVYIENKSEAPVDFVVSGSTTVNGFELNPYFYRTLEHGKKANTSITWFNDDLEENGITEVEHLVLDISIEDPEDFFADPFYEDKIAVEVTDVEYEDF